MFGLGQAQKLGIKIEKYPNRAVATYKNIRVETKLVNGNVETTVSGIPKVPYPIKGIIKRTSDGYIAQTVFVGPFPLGTIKYRILFTNFIDLIDCCITKTVETIAITIVLAVTYFVLTPVPDPIDILVILLVVTTILLAPAIAFIMCTE